MADVDSSAETLHHAKTFLSSELYERDKKYYRCRFPTKKLCGFVGSYSETSVHIARHWKCPLYVCKACCQELYDQTEIYMHQTRDGRKCSSEIVHAVVPPRERVVNVWKSRNALMTIITAADYKKERRAYLRRQAEIPVALPRSRAPSYVILEEHEDYRTRPEAPVPRQEPVVRQRPPSIVRPLPEELSQGRSEHFFPTELSGPIFSNEEAASTSSSTSQQPASQQPERPQFIHQGATFPNRAPPSRERSCEPAAPIAPKRGRGRPPGSRIQSRQQSLAPADPDPNDPFIPEEYIGPITRHRSRDPNVDWHVSHPEQRRKSRGRSRERKVIAPRRLPQSGADMTHPDAVQARLKQEQGAQRLSGAERRMRDNSCDRAPPGMSTAPAAQRIPPQAGAIGGQRSISKAEAPTPRGLSTEPGAQRLPLNRPGAVAGRGPSTEPAQRLPPQGAFLQQAENRKRALNTDPGAQRIPPQAGAVGNKRAPSRAPLEAEAAPRLPPSGAPLQLPGNRQRASSRAEAAPPRGLSTEPAAQRLPPAGAALQRAKEAVPPTRIRQGTKRFSPTPERTPTKRPAVPPARRNQSTDGFTPAPVVAPVLRAPKPEFNPQSEVRKRKISSEGAAPPPAQRRRQSTNRYSPEPEVQRPPSNRPPPPLVSVSKRSNSCVTDTAADRAQNVNRPESKPSLDERQAPRRLPKPEDTTQFPLANRPEKKTPFEVAMSSNLTQTRGRSTTPGKVNTSVAPPRRLSREDLRGEVDIAIHTPAQFAARGRSQVTYRHRSMSNEKASDNQLGVTKTQRIVAAQHMSQGTSLAHPSQNRMGSLLSNPLTEMVPAEVPPAPPKKRDSFAALAKKKLQKLEQNVHLETDVEIDLDALINSRPSTSAAAPAKRDSEGRHNDRRRHDDRRRDNGRHRNNHY